MSEIPINIVDQLQILLSQLFDLDSVEAADELANMAIDCIPQLLDSDQAAGPQLLFSFVKCMRSLGYHRQSQSILSRLASSEVPEYRGRIADCHLDLNETELLLSHEFTAVPHSHFDNLSVDELVTLVVSSTGHATSYQTFLNDLGGLSSASANLLFKHLSCQYVAARESEFFDVGSVDSFDKVELKNISALRKPPVLHWDHLLYAETFGILTTVNGAPRRIKPIATVVMNIMQAIFAHVYLTPTCLVVPHYSGFVKDLIGFTLIEPSGKGAVSIVSKITSLSRRPEYSHQLISVIVRSLASGGRTSEVESGHECEKYLCVGHNPNYGHTIINAIDCLPVLANCERSVNGGIIFGNYDYLSTYDLLRLDDSPSLSRFQHVLTFGEADYHSADSYVFLNKFLFPLLSIRPPLTALSILWNTSLSAPNEVDGRGKLSAPDQVSRSVYLSLDNRRGNRNWINKLELVDLLASFCEESKGLSLIIDGLTAMPSYGLTEAGALLPSYSNVGLPSGLLRECESICQAYEIDSYILDGMPFHEKLKLLTAHRVVCALSPYGSGMVFPIYVINCPIGIFGQAWIGNQLEPWRWHHTTYCHPKRYVRECFIDSDYHGSDGYVVSLNSVNLFLDQFRVHSPSA
jgi:hypothetical protein